MRPHGTRRLAVLAILVAVGGCGMPDDRVPRIIAADEAPLDLSETAGNAGTTTPEGDDEVRLYFVREGILTPTDRPSEGDDLETAITLLLGGPTEDEVLLDSSIPSETELNTAQVEGVTAILDLGCAGEVPAGEQCGVLAVGAVEQLTIFAQLTCTATEVPGVDGVRFLQEGQPVDPPSDSGTIRSPDTATCDDYRSLQG